MSQFPIHDVAVVFPKVPCNARPQQIQIGKELVINTDANMARLHKGFTEALQSNHIKNLLLLIFWHSDTAEVNFASFLSGGSITAIVLNPLERNLAKRTSVHCCKCSRSTVYRSFAALPLYLDCVYLQFGARTGLYVEIFLIIACQLLNFYGCNQRWMCRGV
jgi:hypothetical protein